MYFTTRTFLNQRFWNRSSRTFVKEMIFGRLVSIKNYITLIKRSALKTSLPVKHPYYNSEHSTDGGCFPPIPNRLSIARPRCSDTIWLSGVTRIYVLPFLLSHLSPQSYILYHTLPGTGSLWFSQIMTYSHKNIGGFTYVTLYLMITVESIEQIWYVDSYRALMYCVGKTSK